MLSFQLLKTKFLLDSVFRARYEYCPLFDDQKSVCSKTDIESKYDDNLKLHSKLDC